MKLSALNLEILQIKFFGVAIDIGTTTVVCELVDMNTGKQLANSSMINAQKHFGLDVLTRITYEIENPEDGINKLQTAIVDSINDMIEDVCHKTGIEKKYIYEVSVGANCTMMHMLLGISAKTIGKSPYAPVFTGSKKYFSQRNRNKKSQKKDVYTVFLQYLPT